MNIRFLTLFIILYCYVIKCQNETSKWYFGNNVALDFASSPPLQPGNSNMQSVEACASIADPNGNLLFYSNGENVWDAGHNIMANGSGILGDASASQGTLILKQPGFNHRYYLFTVDDWMGNNGLCYSIIDMSLAAGMGSVTAKNILLLNPKPSEVICSIRHCNNTDLWVVGIDPTNNSFFSFLLSNTGVSAVPVATPLNIPAANLIIGQLKSSPIGNKVLSALTYSNNFISVKLYDFDQQNGTFSNEIVLQDTSSPVFINTYFRYYGCEFSPDGSKLYASKFSGKIDQWDLCAININALKQSRVLLTDTNLVNTRSMQLAPDGKIYITGHNQQNLGIIHQPNLAGQACNYTSNALPITSGTLTSGLPNFPSHYFFKKNPLPFTSTLSCRTASFSPSALTCGSPIVQAYVWNFGDPQVPAQNTSTLQNPVHTYNATGTYTASLVRQFACYSDTIHQTLTVAGITPNLQHDAPTLMCINETRSITTSGADTYVWNNGQAGNQFVITPTVSGSYTYTVTGTSTLGCSATKTLSISVSKCTGLEQETGLSRIKIYPNPFQNILKIETEEELQLTIFTKLGTVVLHQNLEKRDSEIDLRKLSPALYYLKVENKKGQTAYYKVLKTD